MKKKLLVFGGVAIIFIAVASIVGYNYLFPNDDLVMEDHDTSNLIQTNTIVGFEGNTIVSIEPMIGNFISVQDSSELFFTNGVGSGTSGRFNNFTVTIDGDGTAVGMEIKVQVDSKSLYTFNDLRDEHLQGEEFFNTEKFTDITFESSKVELVDSGYVAFGTMKFLGLESNIEVPFKYAGKALNANDEEYHVLEGSYTFGPAGFGMEVGATISETVSVSFYLAMIGMD